MNLPTSHRRLERLVAVLVIAIPLSAFCRSACDADPSRTPIIIIAMSLVTGVLAVAAIEFLNQRNVQADNARAANARCSLFEKRVSSLNDENKRLFNVYLSHLPVEVIIRTLAQMGGGPIRIRDFGPETEWFKVATSPKYRHLFDQDDLGKLEREAKSRKDGVR